MLVPFIFGTIIGSFLNVVIYRSENGEKLTGRSHCPNCHKKLSWWELIPVLSFFILRGKCSKCKAKISWQYPIIELLTGLSFALIYWRFIKFPFFQATVFGNFGWPTILAGLLLVIWFFYISVLIVISVFDLRTYYILDNVLIIGTIAAFISQSVYYFLGYKNLLLFFPKTGLNFLGEANYFFGLNNLAFNYLLGALIYFAILGILAYGSRGKAMGLGDPKLGIFLGLILGWPAALVALIISFLIGGITGLVLILLGKKKMKSQLPFGPFLALGAFIVIILGDIILKGYFKLFI